jgi:hypothetical protein
VLSNHVANIAMRTTLLVMLAFWLSTAVGLSQERRPPDAWDSGPVQPRRLPAVESPLATSPATSSPAQYVTEASPQSTLVLPPSEAFVDDVVAPAEKSTYYWYQPWTKEWDGSFELGLNGTAGNSETFNLRFGGKLESKTDFSTQTLKALYNDQSSNGVNSARNALLNGKIEWPCGDTRWSIFLHGLGEYDEFKPFDYRLSGDAGLAYMFFDNDVTKLKGRFGGSASKEYGSLDDDVKPEVVFGMEWERKLSERQKASVTIDYYPTVTDFSDARINGDASWEVVVDPEWGLSFKLSAITRYDSTPSGAKHNDVNYAALMLWSF